MQLQKKIFILFVFMLTANSGLFAQQVYLIIQGSSDIETNYLKRHLNDSVFLNGQDAENALKELEFTLIKNGYLSLQRGNIQKKDSLHLVEFDLGKKIDSIKITFNPEQKLLLKDLADIQEPY